MSERVVMKMHAPDIDEADIQNWTLEVRFRTRDTDDMIRVVFAIKQAANEALAKRVSDGVSRDVSQMPER